MATYSSRVKLPPQEKEVPCQPLACSERSLKQLQVITALIKSDHLRHQGLGVALHHITEVAALSFDVFRVGVWRYTADRTEIHCVDLYEKTLPRHSSGMTLAASNYPVYFSSLAQLEIIAAQDAMNDFRTHEFVNHYLKPLNIASMMSVPIFKQGVLEGVLCHEHRGNLRIWYPDEQLLAIAIANLVSLAMEHQEKQETEKKLRQAHDELEKRVKERTFELSNSIAELQTEIQERQQAEAALKRSQDRYRSLVKASAQVIWTTTAKGEMVEDLPSWRTFTGQTEEELKGRGWMKQLHPDDIPHTTKTWAHSLATKSAHENEFRLRTPDGTYRHVYARAVPILEPNGEIREWVGTCTDITLRKQAEESLKQKTEDLARSNKQLQQLSQIKNEFVTMITHELRTPLSAMMEGVNLILDRIDGPVTPDQEQTLGIIKRNVDRLGRMINNVLDLQKLSSGLGEMNFSLNPLKEIMEEVYLTLKPEAHKKGLSIALKIPQKTTLIYCDADRIKQALLNLTENAIKFTDPKGSVTLQARLSPQSASLEVKDTGLGINSKNRNRIFEMFSQSTRATYQGLQRTGGFGVGLAVCKKIAELHRGKIEVKSSEGKGSHFILTIPYHASASSSHEVYS